MAETLPGQRDRRAELFAALIDEAQSLRCTYEPVWDQSLRRVLGDQWDTPKPTGLDRYVINRIQNATVATAAIQTEQPPRIRFEPRETNDPPIFFLAEEAMPKAQQVGLQVDPFTPMDENGVGQLMAITQPGVTEQVGPDGQPVQVEGQVPLFTPDDFIAVDDLTATREIQTIFDAVWSRVDMDFYLNENVYNKNVFGTQPMLVEWDAERHLPVVTNPHLKNVWIDPLATSIDNARYAILAEVLSLAEAKKRFPQIDPEVLEREARDGHLSGSENVSSRSISLGSPFTNTDFGRKMVIVWTVWQRDDELAMDPEDAVSEGHVESVDGEDGTFVLPDGRVTSPEDDLFPTAPGIRQMQMVAGRIVADFRSPWKTLPFGWNVNIPIPYRPWGQGEPERLEDVQQAINRVFSILGNYIKYFQSPMLLMSQAAAEGLKAAKSSLFSRPNQTIVYPDYLIAQLQGRAPVEAIQPPGLPGEYLNLARMLLDEVDRLSGFQDVLQGEAKSGASGILVQALQGAARGVIGYKSRYTERMLVHVARLFVQSFIDFMPEAEWSRYTSTPPQVQRAIRDRLKSLEVDVSVEVISGKGANRESLKQEYRDLFDRGTLSGQTLNEIHNVPDAAGEVQRRATEMMALQPVEPAGDSSSGEPPA